MDSDEENDNNSFSINLPAHIQAQWDGAPPSHDSSEEEDPQNSSFSLASQPEAQPQQSSQTLYPGMSPRAIPVSQKPGMLQHPGQASPRNLQHRQNLVSSTSDPNKPRTRITRQLTATGPPASSPSTAQKRVAESDDDDPFANKSNLFGEESNKQIFNAQTTTGPFSIDSAIIDTGDLFHDLLFKSTNIISFD